MEGINMVNGMKGISGFLKDKGFSSFLIVFLAGFISFAGCSSNSNSGTNPRAQSNLVIGITDDEGDFLAYSVDVLSLTLTKKNGAVVDVLPVKTRVDFAQYTDMIEFLTAATVPTGEYVSAKVTLDYSNADIQVEDESGHAVQADSIVDEDGSPIKALTLDVSLEGHDSLIIAPGIPASLNLDFDLAASNTVKFTGSTAVVTVTPVLLAKVNVDIPEIHRVRGPLERGSVDLSTGSFKVIVRPFIHAMTGSDKKFGILDINTTGTTVYQIDGVSYQGNAGLEKLATMPAYTAIIVMGSLTHSPLRFEAQEVYAGSSVPGGQHDVLWGTVIKRSTDTLIIKGGSLMHAGGSVVFNDDVTVKLGDNTNVSKQLSAEAGNITDISVGQRIIAFGTASSEGGSVNFDASSGSVRMMLSTLRGTVVSRNTNTLTIDLQAIDGRKISIFDFTGTGIDSAHNADPDHYEIDTSALDTTALKAGTPVRIRGFVTPFGQAPEDFEARTVVNVSQVPAVMHVVWNPASTEAVYDLSSAGFSLDLTGEGLFHHILQVGVVTDLDTLAQPPSLVPAASGGLYFISQGSAIQLFTTFGDFVTDLATRLTGGAAVKGLIATGEFDESSSTLEATNITMNLK
jgi:hypothetical protein